MIEVERGRDMCGVRALPSRQYSPSHERSGSWIIPRGKQLTKVKYNIVISAPGSSMIMEAVISLRCEENWITQLVLRHPVRVRVIDCIKAGEGMTKDLVEIKHMGLEREEVLKAVRALPSVSEAEVESAERDSLYAIITLRGCSCCEAFLRCDCFMVSGTSGEDGFVSYKIIFTNRKVLQGLLCALQEGGAEVHLQKIVGIKNEELLTEKQEQMVRTAYKRGYYDFPKRIGIKELAEIFGVSTATLSEILRRGQRKIIERYFET
ncbi:MAG: helix-turn-helix domain-containing protein [Candidatus Thermoplasmatota archaeon]